MDIARQIYPDIPAVFSNTGLEYPEIQKFVKTYDNVDIIVPEMRFDQTISKFGYPLIGKEVALHIYYARRLTTTKMVERGRVELLGKRMYEGEPSFYNKTKWLPLAREVPVPISSECCRVLKKEPIKAYQKKNHYLPITGIQATESRRRKAAWIRSGCNAFNSNYPMSTPMAFWTEQNVLEYLVMYGIKIADAYGDIVGVDDKGNECSLYNMEGNIAPKLKCTGCSRTGCIFCGFGFHLDKGETRFQRLARTHPRQYEYAIGGGQWVDNPAYDPTAPEYDGEWKNWNPKQIWVPSKKGLGMGKVFDMVNEVYGKDFYKYE